MTAVPRFVEALTAAMPAERPRLFAAVMLDDTAAAAAAAAAAEGRFMGTAGCAPPIASVGGVSRSTRPSFASLAESHRRSSGNEQRDTSAERTTRCTRVSYLEDLRTQAGRP